MASFYVEKSGEATEEGSTSSADDARPSTKGFENIGESFQYNDSSDDEEWKYGSDHSNEVKSSDEDYEQVEEENEQIEEEDRENSNDDASDYNDVEELESS
ncbi:hypothetical protein NE237_008048 [Protea cynaroides]|uniref:Uncharacterized protein n=1 Tax=Protea cynaroides TaxID=273540 RepID=A0A9Q0KRB1_9MAGN|nr:hypothetical protein NE237_008048 [Protea cynaroides]